jgi:CheY-like chemotaxis protein/two-component sensor histidine kinase
MSHEIRTPLTGIIGFAGVLGEEVEEEHREFAHLIKRSGRRLLETINSVLDLAQLESDGLEPSPEPLDLAEEARQAVLLLTPLAEKKGLALEFQADDTATVSADPTCLHRVFSNIVGNAIKFTEEGEVTVTVRTDGEHAHIEVQDSGVGIDPEFVPHLFNEFRQEVKKSDREGSGLGLAITKKLVDLMDGTVSVESTKGEGSRFTVTFPLLDPAVDSEKKPAKAPTAQPDAGDDHTEEKSRQAEDKAAVDTDYDASATETPPAGKPTVEFTEDAALDAADDDPDDGAMLASIFSQVEWSPEPKGGDGEAEEPVLSLFNEQIAAAIQQAADEADEATHDGGSGTDKDEAPDASNRVLVVTDNATSRDRIVRAASEVWAVETVTEARAVLGRMAQEQYAALVIDVNVGGKQTGANVLRVARALPGYGKVFAVALTAAKSERDYAKKAGFNCCLQEPFTNTALLDALRPALSPKTSAK